MLVSRSSLENPSPLERCVRTSSPSRTSTRRPSACSSTRSLSASVDFPAPERPVNQTTNPLSVTQQSPTLPDAAVQDAEEAVDGDPDEEDHQHQGQQAHGVREIASELQPLADRGLVVDDHQQLAGHQASPGERPALLQAADEGGQRGGQDDMAVERQAAGAHRPADPNQQGRNVVDAVEEPAGDGGRGTRTTTKMIAFSLSWKSRMARGNQTIEGID